MLLSEVGGRLKALGLEQEQSPVSMAGIVLAADLLDEGKISSKQLKQLFDVCFEKGEDFAAVYEREKPQQITDASAIEAHDRRGHRRQPQAGGAVSRRQEDGGRILRRPGDEGLQGPGQPGPAQRAGDQEAGRLKQGSKYAPAKPEAPRLQTPQRGLWQRSMQASSLWQHSMQVAPLAELHAGSSQQPVAELHASSTLSHAP